jgi:hypothetical protein
LNFGGEFNFNAGAVDDTTSYLAENLYTGLLKNIQLDTMTPKYGAYKFSPYLLPLEEISEFHTNYTNVTTFLLFLDFDMPGQTGVYFLDINNALAITKVTDSNLSNVTPNTIDEINGSLSALVGAFGNVSIGLLYYNINGDTIDTRRSETYARFKCYVPAAPWNRTRYKERVGQRLLARNGRCLMFKSPSASVQDHMGSIVFSIGDTSRYYV